MNIDRIGHLLATFTLFCEFGGVDVHREEEVHPMQIPYLRIIYEGTCIGAQLNHIE